MIVEDHPLMLEGIAALLREQPGIDVVGLACNGLEALEKATLLRPDVVLMDIGMPLMDGLEATRQLQATLPEIRVLMLTMHNEPEYIMQVMRAGAAGYVLKDISADKLIHAITAVHQGISVFPALQQLPEIENQLTARETEVLILLVKGTSRKGNSAKANSSKANSAKDIARELACSDRTIETHLKNIYAKLGVRTPLLLVEYARKHGLI